MTKLNCECKIEDRTENESQREWLKRCMCQFHWMSTDYYQEKFEASWIGPPHGSEIREDLIELIQKMEENKKK